jgi:hypothetical protein
MDNLPRYIAAFRNKTDGGGFLAQLITADPAEREAFARQWDKAGVSVYDCRNPLLPDAHTREKATVAEKDEIWVDIDLKDLLAGRDTVLDTLWALPRFAELRDSGGGGFHVGIKLKEPEPHGTPGFERVNELRSQLTHILSGDPIVNQHAHLLRRPGTHNSNYDPAGECHTIRAGVPVEITEVETLLDRFSQPLFQRKPKAAKLNGGSHGGDTEKLPFDLEQRATELHYPGNIHTFERDGTASLIASGVGLESAVNAVLDAVRAHIENCPPRRPWNWGREYVRIQRMAYSWVNKHTDLASRPPPSLYDEYNRVLRARGEPWLHYDRSRKGWWVKDKTPPHAEQAAPEPPPKKPRKVHAVPFTSPEEASLPVRSFLFSQHYQRGQCTMTIGTDGAGKSTLSIAETISIVIRRMQGTNTGKH